MRRASRFGPVGIVVLLLAAAVFALPAAARTVASSAAAARTACTITYTGGDKADPLTWEQPTNWSPAREPGAADFACIPAGFPGGTVSVGDGSKVRGVSVLDSAGLRLHNFGLQLLGAGTTSTIENVDVGSLATFTIGPHVTLELTGTQGGAGLTGFGSAALAGSGTVVVAGGARLGFGAGIQGSLSFEVAHGGEVDLKSAYFDHAVSARFLNYGTVVIAPPPSKGFVDNFGTNSSGSFVNERGATVRDPAGAATFQFQVPFVNAGSVAVSSGQRLLLLGGGTGAAGSSYAVTPRATLEFGGGTFQLARAALSGNGTFDFQLGTVILGGQSIANVAQCGTSQGPFTVTRSWISALCTSNGEAVLVDAGKPTTTTFAHGSRARVGYGGFLVLGKGHRLVNLGVLTDQSDICLAGGSQLTNQGVLRGIVSPSGTTREIHPNCGLPGATGRLVNAAGGLLVGTTATIDVHVPFTNGGHVRGKVKIEQP